MSEPNIARQGRSVLVPRVYLAGKICKDGWRNELVSNRRLSFWTDADGPADWPIEWSAVREDGYTITGPFFVGCDHGCTHGNMNHASSGGCQYGDTYLARRSIQRMCLTAIDGSDVVFVWFDDPTAYGTLAEIGYASAAGKRIYFACPPCPSGFDVNPPEDHRCECVLHGETWFAAGLADHVVMAPDVRQAFDLMVEDWRRVNPFFDSKVEADFWQAHREIGSPITDLEAQFEITTPQFKRYRLDFFSPQLRLAIEVDGLAYHNGQESFISDRTRQRDLEVMGIRVMRFAAKEVMEDPIKCAREASAWALALANDAGGGS